MKIGDYVRFKDKRGNTYIRKIIDLPQDIRYGAIEIDIETNYSNMLSPKNIIKSSPNIIDLIEAGDYVNGFRVDKVEKDIDYITFGDEKLTLASKFNYDKYTIMGEQIKSILTKEQFESMEYKVGE